MLNNKEISLHSSREDQSAAFRLQTAESAVFRDYYIGPDPNCDKLLSEVDSDYNSEAESYSRVNIFCTCRPVPFVVISKIDIKN